MVGGMARAHTSRLVVALLLCCALPAGAATAPRDKRLELEEELARMKKAVGDEQRAWDALNEKSTEDLVAERQTTRSPERYLRIMEVLLDRLASKRSREELRAALGEPFENPGGSMTYYRFGGTWTQLYTRGKPSGSCLRDWTVKEVELPAEGKSDRAGEPITQSNLTRLEVRRVRTTRTIYLENLDALAAKSRLYAHALSFEDLVRLRKENNSPLDHDTLMRELFGRIPVGAARKDVHNWAGPPPQASEEAEAYPLGMGAYHFGYADQKVVSCGFIHTWSFAE